MEKIFKIKNCELESITRSIDKKSVRVIDENLLKIKIPPNETAGAKKLSLKAEEEEDILIKFEVLPSETPQITITEIRPEAGESGDLITIYGINFTGDVKVNIGGIDATSLTVVDRSQVNVMIPDGMQAGAVTITVRNEKGTASIPYVIE